MSRPEPGPTGVTPPVPTPRAEVVTLARAGPIAIAGRWLAGLAWLSAVAILALWCIGRLASDRWLWSQFLSWIPSHMALGAAGLIWLAAAIGRLGQELAQKPPRPAAGRLARSEDLKPATPGHRSQYHRFWRPKSWRQKSCRWPALGLILAGAWVWVLAVEWRLASWTSRAVLGASVPDAAAAAQTNSASSAFPLRVMYWNAWAVPPAELPLALPAAWRRAGWEQGPDVLVLANFHWRADLPAIGRSLGGPVFPVNTGQFVVFSRRPIGRWGVATLGLSAIEPAAVPGDDPADGSRRRDPGAAMFIEVTAPAGDLTADSLADPPTDGTFDPVVGPDEALAADLSKPVTLWIVDLPSDPRLPRAAVATKARRAIDNWSGLSFRWQPDQPAEIVPMQGGFPPADMIVGDLNIPRGSASLRTLAPGLIDAHAQAGVGPALTWPSPWRLWAIDQALVAPPLRADEFHVVPMPVGTHAAVLVRLAAER